MNDLKSYARLKSSNKSLIELLASESSFSNVPSTWQVVVVDIQNSTHAVKEGKHHQINLTATGAIISVLNTIRKEGKNVEIPYFFGGDGATFIVPKVLLSKVTSVLENYRLHIKRKTKLILRVGYISVEELNDQKTTIKIAKHRLTEQLTIPIVLGNGLKKAEEIIKTNFVENNATSFKKDLLNLEGMECRWKEINPSQTKNKVVCLLLDATDEATQIEVYSEVLSKIDSLFGTFKNRQPIKSQSLKLNYSIYNIWEEMKISLVNKSWMYLFKNWFSTLIGTLYLRITSTGKQYLQQISQLSHTFMLDGMINTIFTGEQSKIDAFLEYLNQLEKEKKIIFGIHITHASVMSCYVLDRKTKHSHFVDGTEGGYTSAAKMFKMKLKG
ncbi:DUF3095 family protein [Aequorivita sp. KMM 9714]|uniref:DUF3095 family protein n=1 Tax=Aequorivita sp. KMM 9714 TaxID=2707173 RepID=UPI0013E9B19A|nr:DUF3095 family protein [Aequorivita sp. KMM 9714]NGX83792.1 DUF3095 domain-containing protein [Aequorivita sp. KMM 9714]